jgi:hypothetical protein
MMLYVLYIIMLYIFYILCIRLEWSADRYHDTIHTTPVGGRMQGAAAAMCHARSGGCTVCNLGAIGAEQPLHGACKHAVGCSIGNISYFVYASWGYNVCYVSPSRDTWYTS